MHTHTHTDTQTYTHTHTHTHTHTPETSSSLCLFQKGSILSIPSIVGRPISVGFW